MAGYGWCGFDPGPPAPWVSSELFELKPCFSAQRGVHENRTEARQYTVAADRGGTQIGIESSGLAAEHGYEIAAPATSLLGLFSAASASARCLIV